LGESGLRDLDWGFLLSVTAFAILGIFLGMKLSHRIDGARLKPAFLVDVRSAGEFASGSVPGAVNIPLDQIEAKLDKFKGKKSIIVFCLSGGRSSQAQVILERNGFDNVLNGGTWNHVASLKKSI
jgi:rhodanese-like protein